MKNIAIIGSGSWGVALAIHLANMGHSVKIWSFSEEEANLINNERKCKFLPKAKIPENIECKNSYEEVIKGADFILHVTPSKFTRNIVKEYKQYVDVKNQPIIICSKGIEKDTCLTLDEVISQEIPNVRVGALSRSKSCRRSINFTSNSTSYSFKRRRNKKNDTRYIYE